MKFLTQLILALVFAATVNAQLLQQSDLEYVGAFRFPTGSFASCQSAGFAYGGSALAYNPANNSLFAVGHDYCQAVAEITIPTPGTGAYTALPVATVLQNFLEPSEGLRSQTDPGEVNGIKVGGMAVIGNNLHFTEFSYYDAAGNAQSSHFKRLLTLTTSGAVAGPFKIGSLNPGFYAGWLVPVPQTWQSSLGGPYLTGQCCLSIITRTSFGPSLFSYDPANLGSVSPVPANPLVYYPSNHTSLGGWNQTGNLFNGSTQIRGAVFPEGTKSVLFFGRQGIGTWCYGSGATCNDPVNSSQGNHAYPYVYQVWAYDAAELAKVKAGLKQPWEVVPYTVWNFELPLQDGNRFLGGAAYDPATRRLFLVAYYAGTNGWPVVHVFNVHIPPPPVIEADFTITTKEGRTITVSRQPTTPASNAILVVDPSMKVLVNGEVVP